MFGLEWRDVDLPTAIITVRDPKEGETKRLPISDAVRDLLMAQNPQEAGRVFPWDAHNFINRVFIPAVRKAEIRDFRFHDLRHTFASRLAMRGVDLFTVGKLMGHHGTRMTERYAHLSNQHLRDAVQALGATTGATRLYEETKRWWTQQDLNLRPHACE